MAINYTVSYTFSPNTTILSAEVNTNFADNANTWNGLEAKTLSFSNLVVDTAPTSSTDVAIKSYVDNLNNYRRPVLIYSSATVVNLETGINGASGQAQILFPDGTLRTDSTASHINFDITRNAALSGSAQSGLRTSLSEAVNTWYHLYAVKITDSTGFVVVGDTVGPTQANFATLSSNFGTNGWEYLGLIRNGDNAGSTGDILRFSMVGNRTIFRNAATGIAINIVGVRLANTAGATTLTYTYAAGTGAAQIPGHLVIGTYVGSTNTDNGLGTLSQANGLNYGYVGAVTGQGAMIRVADVGLADGLVCSTSSGSVGYDITIAGWIDPVLGVGGNPIL